MARRSSSFVYPFEALGGCSSRFVEYVFLPLDLCESCLWLLDYALIFFNVINRCSPSFAVSKLVYFILVH